MDYNQIQIELEKLSRIELAQYISEITQTKICKDKKFCDILLKVFLKK
jgi:hypothetical protein